MDKIISQDLLQKIANYLAGRPYIEVAGLIEALAQLKQVIEPEVVSEKVTEKK